MKKYFMTMQNTFSGLLSMERSWRIIPQFMNIVFLRMRKLTSLLHV